MTQIPQPVLDEIKKHNVMTFKTLAVDHGAVTNAIAFLLNHNMSEMAQHLRQMVQSGYIRIGPLDGFVAAGLLLEQGEFIVLSTLYIEFNTNAEMMASLVQEVGYLNAFNKSTEENELRAQKALEWLNQQKSAAPTPSFISSAALKMERKTK